MASIFDNLQITGRGSQALAPVGQTDLVRLMDLQALVSGTLPGGPVHVADIVDWDTAAGVKMLGLLQNTGTLQWSSPDDIHISGVVRVLANGGVQAGPNGLYLDMTKVSAPGHHHVAADIDDFAASAKVVMQNTIEDTASINWTVDANGNLSGVVNVRPAGGVLIGSDGLFVDLGTAHTQAAFGDHSHAQLHDPFQIAVSNSIAWSLNDQTLSAEVNVPANGGLTLLPANVIPNGATYAIIVYILAGLTPGATYSYIPGPNELVGPNGLTADGTFVAPPSGTVNIFAHHPTSDPVTAVVSLATIGVQCDFGPGHFQVARGDHVHANDHVPVTTRSTPTLIMGVDGNQVVSGTVRLKSAVAAGQGVISSDSGGLFLQLGVGASQSAAGDHVHGVANSSQNGFMSASDKTKLDALGALAAQPSGTLQALTGSFGTPGSTNRFVTETDPRLILDVIHFHIDNFGAVITSGIKSNFILPYDATVAGWDIIGDVNGSINVDIRRKAIGSYPPTLADSIAGSEHPRLSSQIVATDTSLASWLGPLNAGDVLEAGVMSNTALRKVDVFLRVNRLQ